MVFGSNPVPNKMGAKNTNVVRIVVVAREVCLNEWPKALIVPKRYEVRPSLMSIFNF